MFKSKFALVAIIFLLAACFFAWQILAYRAPEPPYDVLQTNGDIEIRQYHNLIVAEVRVRGERYNAIKDGFKQLAAYIFGENKTKKKILMTAPVTQESVKLPMTAPVIQQKSGKEWIVRFVMPDGYTLSTLPKPDNDNIVLLKIPPKKYAVIRFSGRNTQKNISRHENLLSDYVLKYKLEKRGEPSAAFYNPPWILPFLRRNEVMIEIRK